MKYEENETCIVYDYAGNEVSFYTTRAGEKRNFIKRLGEERCEVRAHINNGKEVAWTITASIDDCRNPYYVTRVLNK